MGDDTATRFFAAGRGVAVALAVLVAVALALTPGTYSGTKMLARHYLLTQDIWIAALLILALLVVPRGGRLLALSPAKLAGGIAAALIVGGWIGARAVMARYDLSRDEQMATFDAAIYRTGHAFAAFPAAWRDYWLAINQTFILTIGDREAWVSAYLPVNAALRALFGILDPTLAGPAYAAVGALALWRIAARLWPDHRETQFVVLLLYVASSQLWITAMTAYAMSAHLAFNLVWLWLFLGDRPWRHTAAILVGFLATGLHQPIFHPLFVLPFLNMLFAERRWRLLAVYLLGYAAIGLFWLGWPLWLVAQATTALPAAANNDGIGFVERFLRSATGLHPVGLGLMAANLVRFAVWQHLLLLPLATLGVAATWRGDPIARALTLGIALPVAVMLVILPDQGLGWGYRYLHGLIGSACLLGGYGWRALGDAAPRRAMLAATVASLLVVLPVHAVMAHRFVAPFAAARATILASDADIVLVGDAAAPFVQDLVINRADLSNRPLVLKVSEIRPDQIAALCRHASLAFLDAKPIARIAAQFGLGPKPDQTAGLRAAAAAAGCRTGSAG